MNIFCVGRNYVAHAHELGNDVPDKPLIFMKPESSLISGRDIEFVYPEFSKDVHFEGELVIRLGQVEKGLSREAARNNIDAVTYGIDFTARDIQSELKKKGHPWELSKTFRGSAAVGSFLPLPEEAIKYTTKKNNEAVQFGDTDLMIFDFIDIVLYLQRFWNLKEGDLIFTGTPAGVGPVIPGDEISGLVGDHVLMNCKII